MGCFGGSSSKNDTEEEKRRKEANKRIEKQIQKDKQIYRATHRLLLLGNSIKHPVFDFSFSLPIDSIIVSAVLCLWYSVACMCAGCG